MKFFIFLNQVNDIGQFPLCANFSSHSRQLETVGLKAHIATESVELVDSLIWVGMRLVQTLAEMKGLWCPLWELRSLSLLDWP